MEVIHFKDIDGFKDWLEENNDKEPELILGYYKQKSGKAVYDWSDTVDAALCYGWIDGVRKSIDKERFCIRFTPRKANSNWSAINLQKMDELLANGKVKVAGIAIYEKRRTENERVYSFEQEVIELPKEFIAKIKSNKKAFAFFESLTKSIKNASIWWIISAKRETTKLERLAILIEYCSKQEELPQLTKYKK